MIVSEPWVNAGEPWGERGETEDDLKTTEGFLSRLYFHQYHQKKPYLKSSDKVIMKVIIKVTTKVKHKRVPYVFSEVLSEVFRQGVDKVTRECTILKVNHKRLPYVNLQTTFSEVFRQGVLTRSLKVV